MVFVSLSAHSTSEMLNKFVIDRIEFRFVVPTIFMTPHLKQQERNNGFVGLAGVYVCVCGGGSQIYLGGSRIFFPKVLVWGSSNVLPTT